MFHIAHGHLPTCLGDKALHVCLLPACNKALLAFAHITILALSMQLSLRADDRDKDLCAQQLLLPVLPSEYPVMSWSYLCCNENQINTESVCLCVYVSLTAPGQPVLG